MEKDMDKGFLPIKMEMYTKDNGNKDLGMVMEFINLLKMMKN